MNFDLEKFRKDYKIEKVDGDKFLADIKLALKDGRKNALTERDHDVLNNFLHRVKIVNRLFDLPQEERKKYKLNYYLVFPVVPGKLYSQLRDCANLNVWSASDAKEFHTAKNIVAQEFMKNPFGMFPVMNENDKVIVNDVASALEYYEYFEKKDEKRSVQKIVSHYPDEFKKLVSAVEKDMKELDLPHYRHCTRLVADCIMDNHDLVCLKGLEKTKTTTLGR